MSIEALKLALEMVQNKMFAHAEMYLSEAIEQAQEKTSWTLEDVKKSWKSGYEAGIEQAQPSRSDTKQEPVAWMYTSKWKGNERFFTHYPSELIAYKADKVWPLYTSPPQRQPELNRVDVACDIKTLCVIGELPSNMECIADWVAAGQMPQRQPLTDELVNNLYENLAADERTKQFTAQNWFQAGLSTGEAAHGIKGEA